MLKFREAIAESLRFAAAVLVWLLLDHWAPDQDSLLWDAVTGLVTALLAGGVTYVLLAVIFCRSQIESRWFIENQEIPGSMPEVPFQGAGVASIRLEVRGAHKSALHHLIERVRRKELTFSIDYTFKPAAALRYKKQTGPNTRFVRNVLTVNCKDGVWVGQVAWVDFNVERLASSTQAVEIAIQTKLHSPNIRWVAWALVKSSPGKRGFVLRG